LRAIAPRQALAATKFRLPPVTAGIATGVAVSTQAPRAVADSQASMVIGRIILAVLQADSMRHQEHENLTGVSRFG
jgi:hypothetical protein